MENVAIEQDRVAYLMSVEEVREKRTLWSNNSWAWGVADLMEYNSRKRAIIASLNEDSEVSTTFTDSQIDELFDDPESVEGW